MSASDAEVLDVTVLENLGASVGDDRAFLAELIETFLADGAEQVAAIRAAQVEDDPEALVRPAHTLKSSSGTVGAMRLSATGRELEALARGGKLDGADELIARVEADWRASAESLRAWLARGER